MAFLFGLPSGNKETERMGIVHQEMNVFRQATIYLYSLMGQQLISA